MYKFLLLSIFVAIASARIGNHWFLPQQGNATTPAGQLLEGFNDYFELYNITNIDKCVNIPLLRDINKTLEDLNATKINPVAIIADFVALAGDWKQLRHLCPQVASIYKSFFMTFINAAQEDPKATLLHVLKNVVGHQAEFRGLINEGSDQWQDGQYYEAGKTLGNVTSIVLDGYIRE